MANYDFASELPLPADLGVHRGGSVGDIMGALAGVNYYVDAIATGSATGINGTAMKPLGVRYFVATGMTCSNGQPAHAYIDSVPQGNLLGERVRVALARSGLPPMRGLAPGLMEDARTALDPVPLLSAAASSGVPVCEEVDLPVGDLNGNLRSPGDPKTVWVPDADVRWDRPTKQWMLKRWVQKRDGAGTPVWASGTAPVPVPVPVPAPVPVPVPAPVPVPVPGAEGFRDGGSHPGPLAGWVLAGAAGSALLVALLLR